MNITIKTPSKQQIKAQVLVTLATLGNILFSLVMNLTITLLLLLTIVAIHSSNIARSNAQSYIITNDRLQHETVIYEYNQRTEVWSNGEKLWTLWDTDYYVHIDCAYHVVSTNGHTCVSVQDADSYITNYLEDIDTYFAG